MEERQRRSFTDDYKWQAVDLVASSGRSIGSVAKELGYDGTADAVFNALRLARMRVPPSALKWVAELIGPERFALCECLPRAFRATRNIS